MLFDLFYVRYKNIICRYKKQLDVFFEPYEHPTLKIPRRVQKHLLWLKKGPDGFCTLQDVLRKLQPGDTVTIIEGPVEADGYTWWKMKTSDGLEGWAVEVSVWF
jgi:hypothetical protein